MTFLATGHFPLKAQNLEESWLNWSAYCQRNIARMQELETENNRLFIEAYGLQDELTPEVPEGQITLARADRRKDMAAFLSYAIGFMMGRYSLDAPGLILAHAGSTLDDYYKKVASGKAVVIDQCPVGANAVEVTHLPSPPTGFAPLASLSPQAGEGSKKPLSPEGRGNFRA